MKLDADELKRNCAGQFGNILKSLNPDLTTIIDNGTDGSPCPVCQDGENRAACMDDFETTGAIACRRCPGRVIGADIFSVLQNTLGCTFPEALKMVDEALNGYSLPPASKSTKAKTATDYSVELKNLEKIKEKTQVAGEKVNRYFKFRGLSIDIPPSIRFHPDLPYWEKGKCLGNFPAIVYRYTTIYNELAGLGYIYLSNDGDGKAPVKSPKKNSKKCVASLNGSVIRLFNINNNMTRRLIICEGVENGLAIRQCQRALGMQKCPVWVTGGTSMMQNLVLPEIVKEVILAVDKDRPDIEKGETIGPGEKAALILADRLVDRGIHVTLMKIGPPIPEGKDSLDLLDILNKNYWKPANDNGKNGNNN